jgi:hypothetical protein
VAWTQVCMSSPRLPGVVTPNFSGQQGLPGTQRERRHFWEWEHASSQAIFWGHVDILGLNVAFPDLETPASMPGKVSGNFWCSHPSSLSVFPPPASQQLFPQLEASEAEAQVWLETSGLLLPTDWALQEQEQCPSSGKLELARDWHLEPGMAPGDPRVWEQSALSPPQQPELNPTFPPLVWPQPQLVAEPIECQDQCPPPPPRQGLYGRPQSTQPPAMAAVGSVLVASVITKQKMTQAGIHQWETDELNYGSSVSFNIMQN